MLQIKNERRREKLLEIMDGCPALCVYLFEWNRDPRCDEILAWLKANGLTGKKLREWLLFRFQMSIIAPGPYILDCIARKNDPLNWTPTREKRGVIYA